MSCLFGPVQSRRLGRSLGIDLLPDKICPYDCLYCEVGPTRHHTLERREYLPTAAILAEVDKYLARKGNTHIDVITITAKGEPTLHLGLDRILSHLRAHIGLPVVVLTNGALLPNREVRQTLALADIVVPSLDAAMTPSFQRLNRPVAGCDLNEMIGGLECLLREHPGSIWLEILLVAGINDSEQDIEAMSVVLRRLPPNARHRVQVHTVSRPSRTAVVQALSIERLHHLASRLQAHCALQVDVITAPACLEGMSKIVTHIAAPDRIERSTAAQEDAVLRMVSRRPCTAEEIGAALDCPAQGPCLTGLLDGLMASGRLRHQAQGGMVFYLSAGCPIPAEPFCHKE